MKRLDEIINNDSSFHTRLHIGDDIKCVLGVKGMSNDALADKINKSPLKHLSLKGIAKENPDYIPYTQADLRKKDVDPRVKNIANGIRKGTVPPSIAIKDNSKKGYHYFDGWTRAGVASALGKTHIPTRIVSLE